MLSHALAMHFDDPSKFGMVTFPNVHCNLVFLDIVRLARYACSCFLREKNHERTWQPENHLPISSTIPNKIQRVYPDQSAPFSLMHHYQGPETW
jgi:hypothetical protein